MTQLLETISNHEQLSWLLIIAIIAFAMPVIIIRAIMIDLTQSKKTYDIN